MKEVTRCGNCVNRLYDMGVGFVPEVTMMCGFIGCEVDPDDGCTFGAEGEGGYTKKEYDVCIDGCAAVGCRHDFYDW